MNFECSKLKILGNIKYNKILKYLQSHHIQIQKSGYFYQSSLNVKKKKYKHIISTFLNQVLISQFCSSLNKETDYRKNLKAGNVKFKHENKQNFQSQLKRNRQFSSKNLYIQSSYLERKDGYKLYYFKSLDGTPDFQNLEKKTKE